MVGNFIADSVTANNFSNLSVNVVKGIKLHRKIDTFTDTHLIYLKSKHRFSNEFGKYSGVLMDMIYDHFLAKNFSKYSTVPLQLYSSNIYDTLNNYLEIFPDHAKQFYGYMVKHNVLYNYSTIEGLTEVLTHLNHRIKHRYQLQNSIQLLTQHFEEIEQEFFLFFDDLKEYCLAQEEVYSITI